MSVYSELGGEKEETGFDYVEIDGDFYCTEGCGDSADKALYYPRKGMLAWQCVNGHKSILKDVRL